MPRITSHRSPLLWSPLAGGVVAVLFVALIGCGKEDVHDSTAGPAAPRIAQFDPARLRLAPPEPQPGIDAPPLGEVLDALAAAAPQTIRTLNEPELAEVVRTGKRRTAQQKEEVTIQRNWEIRFLRGQTAETYARQLDHFKIELAVVQPEGQLLYIANLGDAKPTTRTGPVAEEKRFYLTWRGGELSHADLDLLGRADVEGHNRVILKLLPPELEKQLETLERKHAGDKADRVRKTRFEIRSGGAGYELFVVEQWYQ